MQALVVEREKYIRCLALRQRVCHVYAETRSIDAEMRKLPPAGVPEQFMACAQPLREVENVRTVLEGVRLAADTMRHAALNI